MVRGSRDCVFFLSSKNRSSFDRRENNKRKLILSLSLCLVLNTQSLSSIVSGSLDLVHGLLGVVHVDSVVLGVGEEAAADGHEAGAVAAETDAAAAGVLDGDDLSVASTEEGSAVVAAGGFVGDLLEGRVVVEDDVSVVFHSADAKRHAEAGALLQGDGGVIPLQGVLSSVHVLGRLDFLLDVLGKATARKDHAARAELGRVKADQTALLEFPGGDAADKLDLVRSCQRHHGSVVHDLGHGGGQ